METRFDRFKNAKAIAPDPQSMTRFVPFVEIHPDTRDEIVVALEAAHAYIFEPRGVADIQPLRRVQAAFTTLGFEVHE